MAGKTTFATLVLAVVAAAALMEGAAAKVYVVGDATSWTIPSGGAAFYSTWAANHTFAVGDILIFNFVTGAHDVATVTKTSYDSCNTASPISLQSTGPANVTLTTSGEHYYICTVGQHCASGQKLSVNVPAAGSPTPTPSPSPASPTPSPTPAPSTTPSPTPSATPPPAAPTPSPTAHSPPPSSAPTNSPPPPPATESPPPSSTPSPTESTSPPPPPPSSAPRKAVAAFGMVVMSVAIGALF